MKRIAFPTVVTLAFFFFSIATAFAQVQVRMRVIQASNVGQNIDPSLRDVHRELGSLFSFTSYRLLRDESLNLSPNRPATISGHKGTFMEVTLVKQYKNVSELRIRVNRQGEDILNTQVRLSPGRTVLIGGPKHRDGIAIFALSIQS